MVTMKGLVKDKEDRDEEKKGRVKTWIALFAMMMTPLIAVVGFWWSMSTQVAVLQQSSDSTGKTVALVSDKLDRFNNVVVELQVRATDTARRVEAMERVHERGGR